MKTSSILMSSFGALLLLISVNENALKSTDVVSNSNQTENQIELMPVIKEAPSAIPVHPVSKTSNDFSYLKFNVSDFVTVEAGNDEMPAEVNFDYLKFKATEYMEAENKIDAMPENTDFDYLKFDVNTYTTSPCNVEDIPSADFDYLKFDVQKFVQTDPVSEINELPEE